MAKLARFVPSTAALCLSPQHLQHLPMSWRSLARHSLLGSTLVVACVIASSTWAQDASVRPADRPSRSQATQEAHRWVELLGSESFAQRQEAHRVLLAMRHDAYDVLLEASKDSNVEIRLAAQSLLEHLQIQWTRSTDSEEVAKLLKGYGDRPSDERWVWIQRLSKVHSISGRVALARVARYEPSESLSRRSAVLLLEKLPIDSQPQDPRFERIETAELADAIKREISGSRRVSITWVSAYLDWLADPPEGLEEVSRLVRAEVESLSTRTPVAPLERHVVMRLVRWQARMRYATGDTQLQDLNNLLANLIEADERGAKEHLDWLASWQQWNAMVEWSHLQTETIDQWAEALFRVAEAQSRLGHEQAAQALRQRAVEALPVGFEDKEAIAHSLHEFGYHEGATYLLEQLYANSAKNSDEAWRTGLDLVHWHQQADRIADASNLLDQLIEQADEATNGWLSIRSPADREWIRGEQAWLHARCIAGSEQAYESLDAAQQAKFIECLDAALATRPSDVAILTCRASVSRLYKLPDADAWTERIAKRREEIESIIEAVSHDLQRHPIASVELQLEKELAEQQIALSQLVLTLEPLSPQAAELARAAVNRFPENSEYWRVWALALAANERWEAAVLAQRQAVHRAPNAVAWQNELTRWTEIAEKNSASLER